MAKSNIGYYKEEDLKKCKRCGHCKIIHMPYCDGLLEPDYKYSCKCNKFK